MKGPVISREIQILLIYYSYLTYKFKNFDIHLLYIWTLYLFCRQLYYPEHFKGQSKPIYWLAVNDLKPNLITFIYPELWHKHTTTPNDKNKTSLKSSWPQHTYLH